MMTKFLNWFLQLFLPYALLIAGFLFLRGGEGQSRTDKGFDIAFDACILGLGIAAVLLGGPFVPIFQANAAVIPVAIGVIFIAIFFHLKRSGFSQRTKARVAVLASTLIFGSNTAMVTWLSEGRLTPTIGWGIVAWLVPCTVGWFVV